MPEGSLFHEVPQSNLERIEHEFPKISEVVSDERFKSMSAVRQAYTLNQYRNKLTKHLIEKGEIDRDSWEEKTGRINQAIDKHMPSGNSLSAISGSLVDRKEILAEASGLGATLKLSATANAIKENLRNMAVAQAQKGDNSDFYMPGNNELETYVQKNDKLWQEFEDMRAGLEEMISEDKNIQGRDMILGQGVSLSTIGNVGSRMAIDIPAATLASAAAGPAGAVGYYSLTQAARSDRALRAQKPDMSVDERLGRSAVTGVAVGSLEAIGFGYITNSQRALKLTEVMKNAIPSEAVRRIGGAALAEGSTEFAQTYLEHFGHNAEALDDFVTIMADGDVFKEALVSAGIGSIMGGGVPSVGYGISKGITFNKQAIDKIVQTDVYKNALKKLEDVKAKVDPIQQMNETTADLWSNIAKLHAQKMNAEEVGAKGQAEAENAQAIIQQFEGVGKFDGSEIPDNSLPPQSESPFHGLDEKGNLIEQGLMRYSEDDIIKGVTQTETSPMETKQKLIRDIILENGGIREDEFHRDYLRTAEGNLQFSPKFLGKKGRGLKVDQIHEILVSQGLMKADEDVGVIIDSITGAKDRFTEDMKAQPDEDFDALEEDGYDPDIEEAPGSGDFFEKLPSSKDATDADENTVIPKTPEQPTLFDDLPPDVKVDELPLSLSDLHKLSKIVSDNPVLVKKVIDRDENTQGAYRIVGDKKWMELKASIFAGPQIASFPKNMSKEAITAKVLKDEKILKRFPDITEQDIIVRDLDDKLTVHKRDHDYAARTFAHEIGHNIDDIDADTLEEFAGITERGNLLGRLQGLKKFTAPKILTDKGEIKNSEIKKELKELTHWWKPFDKASNKRYTTYRYSGPELFADAMSVFFNAPQQLASRAPKFYSALKQFSANKPDIKAMYDGLLSARREGRTASENLKNVENMMEEAGVAKEVVKPDKILKWFVDSFHLIKSELFDSQAQHYRYKKDNKVSEARWKAFEDAHSDFLHASGMGAGYLQAQANLLTEMKTAGITQVNFDSFMFLKLTSDQRKDYANPGALRGQESIETLEQLKEKVGAEKFQKLEQFQKKFNKAREIAKKAFLGSGLMNENLENHIRQNENYIRFQVFDDMKEGFSDQGSAKVFKTVGTLRELKKSPFEATLKQDMALMHLAYLNRAKRSMVNDLILPTDRTEAVRDENGNYKKIMGKEKELFTYMEEGKVKGFYIDNKLASLYDGGVRGAAVVNTASMMMAPFKALWVRYSPAFALRNLPRDFGAAWKQLGGTMQNIPAPIRPFAQGYILAREYARVAPEVFRSAYLDKHSQYIMDMEVAGEINLADPGGVKIDKDYGTEAERIFAEKLGYIEKGKSTFKQIVSAIPNTGRFTELLVRRAGKSVLQNYSNMTPKEITSLLRWFGSPDFLQGGRFKSVLNSIFIFSNANIVGHRQNFRAIKSHPIDYLFKTAVWNVMPKAFALAAINGVLGDELKEWWEQVDELDVSHSLIIPLNYGKLDENGKQEKPKYIRIAQDHFGASLSQIAIGAARRDLNEVVGSSADYIPYTWSSLNPMIRLLFDVGGMHGDNARGPIDHYGNKVVEDDLVGTKEGWKDFGRYEFNSVFGQQFKLTSKSDTGYKDMMPIIAPLYNAMYQDTDRGSLQKEMREYKERRRDKAGYIASVVSDLPNKLTKLEVRREANKAYKEYENKDDQNKASFIRSFELRYKKAKELK